MTRKVVSPIALDKSINTTEQTPRNIADVLAQQLAAIKTAIESGNGNLEAAFVCYYGVTTATQIKEAIEDGKVPYFYYNGAVAQLWKVETDKYTFRTTNTRSVEGQTILDVVDYVVNGSVWSTITREVSGGSSSGQSYIASVNSLADFDTTGKSGMQDLISVANVPADGVYQVSVMLHITPKTASATKSDLVLQFTSSDNTGWPSHTFHAVVDDSQTFAQQLSFSTSVSLKAGQNTLRIQCGGLNTEYLVFVDDLTIAGLVIGGPQPAPVVTSGANIYPTLQKAVSDAANLSVGDIFETNGFHTSGDGGAARYVVSDTGTANGMDIVQLAAGKLAILQIQDFAYPDQLGYTRNVNTTDVVPYIERIFALGILHIKLHWGRYYMRQTLNMPIASSIEGVARAAYDYPAMSRLLYMVDTGSCAINASNYDVCLENFDLYCSGNVSNKIGVLTDSNVDSQRGLAFRNLKISGFQTSIKLSKIVNWNILFDRVTFEFGDYGLWLETNKLVINLSDCYFNGIKEEDVHNKQYSSALSFSHCNFGCRKKVFKNEWNNYDWRNFGDISFYGCHFEVDVYDLADVSGCFIDVDNDCQVSLVFVGCDFNADKANPASTTCFKFGNRTRASYIGCHGKESQYVHFDGDFFDPSYPPEPYVGSLKLDSTCVGLKKPGYDIDHSMCFVDEGTIYKGYTRSNPLNIFDNIVVNYSYAGVRYSGDALEFFTPTPPQSCASIVVEIPPEYRNTTLTLSCWSGTHNEWYVVGTPVHPDSDRTQTPELLADTYQTGGVRDYCSFNMNGNRYLLFYYYLMAADGNPEKFAMSEGLMIAKGSQYTPYAKHMIVDKRGLHISDEFIPPVKSVGINGAVPLSSCNDLVPAETGIEICGEINTFGGTTDTPSGFTGIAMLHCSSHVNYTRLTQWFFGSNGSIYTRRAIRNSQSDQWTWLGWYAFQGTAL